MIKINSKKKEKKRIFINSTVITKNKSIRTIKNVYNPILHIDQATSEYWEDEEYEVEE